MSETLDKIFKNSDFSSIAKSQAKFIRGQSIISKQQFTNR